MFRTAWLPAPIPAPSSTAKPTRLEGHSVSRSRTKVRSRAPAASGQGMASLVADTLEEYGSITREAMAGYFPNGYPARHLYEPLADYPQRAGKMMRPSICIATARAFGASKADAVRSAAAI